MAVLAEGISVVVRVESIARLLNDDWSKFVEIVPNQTLCSDNELARVGFMHPKDVEAFVGTLERRGFRYRGSGGAAMDLVVVEQQRGPAVACDWLEWGRIPMGPDGGSVSACRLTGSQEGQVFTPEGWTFGFQATEDSEQRYRYLRTENGIDVYYDTATGREVYAGRTEG